MSSSHRGLRIAARPTATPLGRKQKRFNLLVKQAAERRALIAEWAARAPDFERTMADGRTLDDVHDGLVAQIVRAGARHLAETTLTRSEATLLRGLICDAAFQLLQHGGYDDLKPIFNRHSGADYDRAAAAESEMHLDAIRGLFERELGVDLDHVKSVEDLHQFAAEKFAELREEEAEAARAAEARRAQRKKTPRQAAAEAVRVAERAQADKALQTIYRALAIALHPDREQDPSERDRKTELMREVNVAYEAKDLLKLLELQLRFEQVDQAALDTIAEDRLDHFNKLLTEQVAQLKEELAMREGEWRERLELPARQKLTPARVMSALRAQVDELRFTILEVRADLVAFETPRGLKTWLRARAREQRDDNPF